MSEQEKSGLELMEDMLKNYWRKHGNPYIIVGRHSEFVVEPRVFMGNKLNPEVLKMLIAHYLASASVQDSGAGKIEVKSDKLIIKSPNGKPLAVVRDKRLIEQYLAQQA